MHTDTCMCILYTQTQGCNWFSKHRDKRTGRIASASKERWQLFLSCKFTEGRGITPWRGLTQNVNSLQKEEVLFVMELFTQKDLLSLLRGCDTQFDVCYFFCRSCFSSSGDGTTSSVRDIYVWFACTCSRKMKFASQPRQDLLHVLGQWRRYHSCLGKEDWNDLCCTSPAPICFPLFPDLAPLFFFLFVWLPEARIPHTACLKLSKMGPHLRPHVFNAI